MSKIHPDPYISAMIDERDSARNAAQKVVDEALRTLEVTQQVLKDSRYKSINELGELQSVGPRVDAACTRYATYARAVELAELAYEHPARWEK
jgi:hypothetical protein